MTGKKYARNATVYNMDNDQTKKPETQPSVPESGQQTGTDAESSNVIDITTRVQQRIQDESLPTGGSGSGGDGGPNADFISECLNLNELGDGALYCKLHSGKFIHANKLGIWLSWEGSHWAEDTMGKSTIAVEQVATAYADHARKLTRDTDAEYRDMLNKRARRLRSIKGRKACVDYAYTMDGGLTISGHELDINPWLFPCFNGVLNLQTGRLEKGRQDDFMLRSSPVSWTDIEAPSPEWQKFLTTVFCEDEQKITFVQRLLGYGMTGLCTEHIFPIFSGVGRNGKGTIVDIIMKVLGDMAGPIQSVMLLDQGMARSSAGPSPDILTLKGLRIAVASETDEGRRFSSSRCKWLTGGDMLTGRYPYDKNEIKFIPNHLLILITNYLPHVSADDFAFWERVFNILFHLSFVRNPKKDHERPMDKNLMVKLTAELSGILAWFMRGCLEWQEYGLNPPDCVLTETTSYQRDEDVIGDWLSCGDISLEPADRGGSTDLYDHYKDWYEHNVSRKSIPSHKRFGSALTKRFVKDDSTGRAVYVGIALNDAGMDKLENVIRKKPYSGPPKRDNEEPLF